MADQKALATLPSTSDRNAWSEDESAAIEAAGLVFVHSYGERKGQRVLAPRPIVARFLHTCERTGLDPLARQIYCIPRFGSDGIEWSVQTGIDGFRVVAERSKLYAGQAPAVWLTAEHGWVDVFIKALHGSHPLAARVKVYRHDWDDDKPAVGIATWDEYVQTKRDGSPTSMWAQRGPGQLAKCAEALAFRKAFPQDLSGLYTSDELAGGGVLQTEESSEPRVPASQRSRVAQLRQAVPAAVEVDEAPVDAELVDEAQDGRVGLAVAGSAAPVESWPVAPIPSDADAPEEVPGS